MKILIIDDDLMTQKALEFQLSQVGNEILLASNGEEAIRLIEGEQKINLIICDLVMPVITGPTFISLLKNYYFNSTPVIVISSLRDGPEMLHKLGVEYNYFLRKPYEVTMLKELVKQLEPPN